MSMSSNYFRNCVKISLLFILKANSGYPDQTPCSAVCDLGLHGLPMSHKRTLDLYEKSFCFFLTLFSMSA